IQSHLSRIQFELAIDTALPIVEKLGVSLPKASVKPSTLARQLRRKLSLDNKQIEDLADLPLMTDPYKLAALRILLAVTPATYITNPTLLPLVTFTTVNLCIKYGNPYLAAAPYAWIGSYLCGRMEDVDFGYRFCQLSLKLLEQFRVQELTARVSHLFNSLVKHWKDHVKETIAPLMEGVQGGIATGDLEFSCFAAINYCLHSFFAGENLEIVEEKYSQYVDLIIKFKQEYSISYIKICRQIVFALLERGSDKFRLHREEFNEVALLAMLLKINDGCSLEILYFSKAISLYFLKEYNQSIESAKLGEQYEAYASGMMVIGQNIFYYSLALLAQYPNAHQEEQKQYIEKVTSNQKRMKRWAHHAPANYQNKYDLVEAEKARVLGKPAKAMELYDRAIQGAREQGFIHEEAIAYERAAEFYLSLGREEIGHFYLKNAHHCYTRWGATAKVKDLEAEYPQILVGTSNRTGVKSLSTVSSTTGTDGEALDLATVIKASQTLTSEIALDKLLAKLMKIAIENAGAQTGFLILPSQTEPGNEQSTWAIEAEGTVGKDDVTTLRSLPIDAIDPSTQLPVLCASIIHYVVHTQENVVLNDATQEGQFTRDPYIVATQPKSILCTPLLNQGKLSGILYLENNLTTGAFTRDRVETLKILSAQAAISIENSRLYAQLADYSRTLEIKVEERTHQLQEKNNELATTLQKLKATQDQIIAQEKLASLGALTAGIAHEIKNPLNFVNNFAELSAELTEELLEEIDNQKERLNSETVEYIEEILADLEQNVKKINQHGRRADNIVRGMLMHSRGKAGEREAIDLNSLLAEYVNLAYHGMRAKDTSFNITIETNYDNSLGRVKVVPQDISRVFLNIVNNACYSAHEKKKEIGKGFSPTLWVSTKDLGEQVEICIRDNGKGIPEDALDKIFNPFFTTKPTGQGTGLGLSISHDIIVQQHRGDIKVKTEAGQYAEFTIILPKQS
ncbi:MAG TPA: ATP-binding protein, partial [Coleofasciculaceae cyanobacterium]